MKFLDMTPILQKYYTGAKQSGLTDTLDIVLQDNSTELASPSAWQTPASSDKPQDSPIPNPSPSSSAGPRSGLRPQLATDNTSGNSQSDLFSFSQSSHVQHLNSHWPVDTAYSIVDSRSKATNPSHYSSPDFPTPPNQATIPRSHNDLSPPSPGFIFPPVHKEQFFWPDSNTTTQSICLIRHFIQNIGRWVSNDPLLWKLALECQADRRKFDIYDRARHFTLVVPQRARSCPPLLNAILTVAAKSLVDDPSYKTQNGTIEFEGIPLPGLTGATAIEYHNKCIAYFLGISDQPELMNDENLLAAAIILRYYEFLDTPRGGEVQEQFVKTFQVLVASQASTAFSPSNNEDPITPANSPLTKSTTGKASHQRTFRPVACWMALRLEVSSAFIKQRSIGIPIDAWATQRSFDTSDDNAWTQRLILHCADLLQFCFADEVAIGKSRGECWKEIKEFEDFWESYMPESFSPILYKEPDRSQGHCFPQIWYMSDCHVLGMQYHDLAGILQTVYDPTIPRLGIGSIVSARQVSSTVQDIVVRMCGSAISNPNIQTALITAHLAISLAGQYFTDNRQQSSILDLLIKLELDYAWPTAKVVAELKHIWSYKQAMGKSDEELERRL